MLAGFKGLESSLGPSRGHSGTKNAAQLATKGATMQRKYLIERFFIGFRYRLENEGQVGVGRSVAAFLNLISNDIS